MSANPDQLHTQTAKVVVVNPLDYNASGQQAEHVPLVLTLPEDASHEQGFNNEATVKTPAIAAPTTAQLHEAETEKVPAYQAPPSDAGHDQLTAANMAQREAAHAKRVSIEEYLSRTGQRKTLNRPGTIPPRRNKRSYFPSETKVLSEPEAPSGAVRVPESRQRTEITPNALDIALGRMAMTVVRAVRSGAQHLNIMNPRGIVEGTPEYEAINVQPAAMAQAAEATKHAAIESDLVPVEAGDAQLIEADEHTVGSAHEPEQTSGQRRRSIGAKIAEVIGRMVQGGARQIGYNDSPVAGTEEIPPHAIYRITEVENDEEESAGVADVNLLSERIEADNEVSAAVQPQAIGGEEDAVSSQPSSLPETVNRGLRAATTAKLVIPKRPTGFINYGAVQAEMNAAQTPSAADEYRAQQAQEGVGIEWLTKMSKVADARDVQNRADYQYAKASGSFDLTGMEMAERFQRNAARSEEMARKEAARYEQQITQPSNQTGGEAPHGGSLPQAA